MIIIQFFSPSINSSTTSYLDTVAPEIWARYLRHLALKLGGSIHVSSVRSWSFDGEHGYASLSLVHVFADTLGVYHNLWSLHLSSTLAGLVRLEKLDFSSCSITALREFHLGRLWGDRDEPTDQPLDLIFFSPEPLHMLSLSGNHHSGAILAGFCAGLSAFPGIPFWRYFSGFLRQCPQLTRLEITCSAFSTHPPSRLPGGLPVDVIPLLYSFKSPRLLAAFFVSDRPLSILELEEGHSFGRGHQPSPEDVISDLVEISYSTAGLQTFTFGIPMRAALQLCRTVAVHWPNLRDLCVILNETPLPHPPTGPFLGNNNHFDDNESDNESSVDVDVDDRDIDFSDNDSLESVRTRASLCIALNFGPTAEVPLPDVLAPGHMYSFHGHASAPPEAPAPRADDPDMFLDLADCICLGRLSLPPSLEALRLRKADWSRFRENLPLSCALLPALIWWRYCNTWKQSCVSMRSGAKIASLYHV
ncbi:hypothetical protein B0H14DRAFT_2951261 [Mycena olivaceomarginata]|nr:hypothetical protein B0H14DRAFT_2951261 [Mycena olivaceomarginata]